MTQMRLVSGPPPLVREAFTAVQWTYRPTLLDGIPVAVGMKVIGNFDLGN